MKNIIWVFIVVLFPLSVLGQIKTIEVRNNKTSHLVFYADIIYADIGDTENFIISYTNNILRIKGVKTFNETNLTVLTKDQSFYSFIVKYDENPRLNYFIEYTDALKTINQTVSRKADIISRGDQLDFKRVPTSYARPNTATDNIGSIEPTNNATPTTPHDYFIETNAPNNTSNIVFNQKSDSKPTTKNLSKIKANANNLLGKPNMYDYIGKRHGDILLKVTGIYHSLDNAYVVYAIQNAGAIPYDISYIEFGVRERRRPKKAAVHERKLSPVYIAKGDITRVLPMQLNKYVAVFDKLAIPSDRMLYLELVEDGRNINLEILYHKIAIKRIH